MATTITGFDGAVVVTGAGDETVKAVRDRDRQIIADLRDAIRFVESDRPKAAIAAAVDAVHGLAEVYGILPPRR